MKKPTQKASSGGSSKSFSSGGSWLELGTIREKNDKPYLVLNKNVTVLVDGVAVDLGEYRTVKLIDPRVGLETSLNNGKINDEVYQERLEAIESRNIVYKVTLPPS